ncbi:chemotaxis protein CheA [Hyphomicrobium sp.]|uniref:chemotaxis protein CheA n=1 Tax=Hyphomicrobium sp. TaxID=82 RepID=UPI002E360ECC|nr:chemotaxis protein CheA [Hyphomicrobium sp.]HEX2839747.1 chemotaxis protein CheA [Hyphomicrobium sp.]
MSQVDLNETFRNEVSELLDRLEQSLLDLESKPGDQDLVDSAFRALHTIKGSGAMFGFEHVAAFTHEFESLFDRIRKGEARISGDVISISLAAKDHIRSLVDRPDSANEKEGTDILERLQDLTSGGPTTAGGAPKIHTASVPAAGAGMATWIIRMRFKRNVLVNGANPLLLLEELRALGDCAIEADVSEVPPLENLDPEQCYISWTARLTTAASRSDIEYVFVFVADEMDLDIERVEAEPVAQHAADPQQEISASQVDQVQHKKKDAPTVAARPTKADTTIRVQAERLDELMDRVGELVIMQARLAQIAERTSDTSIRLVSEEIARLTHGLRDTTMGIRLVPIGSLFTRFRRLVHDLSRDLSKPVEFVTSGEETELDKTVVERLADPLVHIIRNAIDHGLEDPVARGKAGKEATGHISLSARHAGAEVLLTLTDDGRGLDRDRIRAKAIERGLIDASADISDAALFQYIFHPGFSTAKQVSELSGRGVGMDVVKRSMDEMRGKIDLASTPGQGTQVTLRLPLTLAIIEGLLVRVGNGRYIIPLSAVEECVELSESADKRSNGRSFLNIRGDLVPFLRLRELFGSNTPPDLHQKVVIVSAGETKVGLVIDQIIGSHQTVIKSLSKLHADVGTFSGATILGDGTTALILDIAHVVELGQSRERGLAANQRAVA